MREDINLEIWKPNPLPKKDCMFQGVVPCCNKPICDSIGTDISPEFCFYCRHFSKVSGVKPYEFASKFNNFLFEVEKELKGGK